MIFMRKLKAMDWSMLCLSVIGVVLLFISAFDGPAKLFFSLGLIFTGCSGIVNGIRILMKNQKEGQ